LGGGGATESRNFDVNIVRASCEACNSWTHYLIIQSVPYIKRFIYIIKTKQLTVLEEIIAVYSENHVIPINTAPRWQDLFNVKLCMSNNYCVLKD
jgi:hypothetical protein